MPHDSTDIYVGYLPSTHAKTVELIEGKVLADFDGGGQLIGVELLGATYVTVDGVRISNEPAEGDR